MSIISEALRKAQELRRVQEPQASVSAEPPKARGTISPDLIRVAPFIGLIALVVVLAALYLIFRKPAAPQAIQIPQPMPALSHQEVILKPPEAPKQAAASQTSAVVPAPEQLIAPETVRDGRDSRPMPSLVLNGIMYSGQKRYAIINNGMVLEGESVGGAKVERIEKNEVLLKFDSREIILRLKK